MTSRVAGSLTIRDVTWADMTFDMGDMTFDMET